MPPTSRPSLSSRQTATTLLSGTSYASSSCDTHRSPTSTALTSPDLASPRKGQSSGRLEPMLEVFEGSTTPRAMSFDAGNAGTGEVMRGPSVRDRAKEFEQQSQQQTPRQASSSRPRPLPSPTPRKMSRTRSTSPLRIDKSRTVTPTRAPRRVPVPSTAPVQRTAHLYTESPSAYPFPDQQQRRSPPPELKRGQGSTKRMLQQWETSVPNTPMERRLPTAPASAALGARTMSREYLDAKPLPLPRATPLPSSSAYSRSPNNYTSTYNPSPLQKQHLQTPRQVSGRKRAATLSPSPSGYSLSPSPSGGDKRRKGLSSGGRSPLKEMLNLFGGGIKDLGRKAKGKKGKRESGRGVSASPSFGERMGYGAGGSGSGSSGGMDWAAAGGMDERVGSAGLPGGIVFEDRMGDREMALRDDVIRTSPILYLVPTPCSTFAPWGSWIPSQAALTSTTLRITYTPIFQDPASGHSTPRRILSSSNPTPAAVPYAQIPQPDPGQAPDVEMPMAECVEVRSLRREEVKGRGVPVPPEGVATEVLEMTWGDGGKRYIGVEGVAGRLGWVSAIWDVLLACKSSLQPTTLPPPSPQVMTTASPVPTSSLASFPYPSTSANPREHMSDFQARIASLEAKSSLPPLPRASTPKAPVMKVGDTWVAGSALGIAPGSDVTREAPVEAMGEGPEVKGELRDSVQRMFDVGPDLDDPEGGTRPTRGTTTSSSGSAATDRILAWQPQTERDLSIFSRTGSRRSEAHVDREPAEPRGDEDKRISKSDTLLSFDINDLNPSRSASQVRRASTVLGGSGEEPVRRQGFGGGAGRTGQGGGGLTPVMDEGESEGGYTTGRTFLDVGGVAPSHVTFPKPTMGGLPMIASEPSDGGSGSGSSSRTVKTPTTTSMDHATSLLTDPTVDSTTSSLAKQVDGVQLDLHRIIGTLSTLLAQSNPDTAVVPKRLDDKLSSLGLDVKGIENALQLSRLADAREGAGKGQEDQNMQREELNRKLDGIAKVCEQLLARGTLGAVAAVGVGAAAIDGLPTKRDGGAKASVVPSKSEEENVAGAEVAQIMADLTGGSSKASPRLGGLQVLHNVSAPPSPKAGLSPSASPTEPAKKVGAGATTALPDEVGRQVGEVLGLVKELKEARSIQTQQTTDIARYLNELNTWLDKFVQNSSSELAAMSTRLNTLVGPDEPPADGANAAPVGLPGLVADVHSMMSEQKRRNESEGLVGQRLDSLLTMMGEERERQAGQQSTVEQVLAILDRQRHDNEMLLRALATDLTSEIRGERIRFVEAMQQATSVNVQLHVEEFKKVLSGEVQKSMQELGKLREERRALEHQISDLFALKAKHTPGGSRHNSKRVAAPPPTGPPGQQQGMMPPGPGGRGLPLPPGARGY